MTSFYGVSEVNEKGERYKYYGSWSLFFGPLESCDALLVTQVQEKHGCACVKRVSCGASGPNGDECNT